MSAISTILTRLANTVALIRSAIYAIDVRDDIADAIEKCGEAIEQCYSDVSNPTLQTEALEAALQEKIDQGEMAALTIGDHTITAVKLASGVIDNTLATSGAAADAAETGRQFGLINESLGALIAPPRLDNDTDLDSITTPGVYTLYAHSSYLNKPTPDAEHGLLEVWNENYGDNAGRMFQRLTYTYKAGRNNSEIWVRSKSAAAGASWTPWITTQSGLSDEAKEAILDCFRNVAWLDETDGEESFNVLLGAFGMSDFYNTWEWTYPGNLYMYNGTPSYLEGSSTDGVLLDNSTTVARVKRTMFTNKGKLAAVEKVAISGDVFPIPIPSEATSVSATINPSSMQVLLQQWKLQGNVYKLINMSAWLTGTATLNLSPSPDKFLCVNIRYNSSASAFRTEPQGFEITFQ